MCILPAGDGAQAGLQTLVGESQTFGYTIVVIFNHRLIIDKSVVICGHRLCGIKVWPHANTDFVG